VQTDLEGRSDSTVKRAADAGMIPIAGKALVEVPMILSIVPPAQAVSVAEAIVPLLRKVSAKPIYVDFNAINPATVRRVADLVSAAGCDLVDGGIIGSPPRAGYDGPAFYVAGPRAREVEQLSDYGLNIRVADGPIGTASALKMCYGGITKGLIAIGSAMALAAMRFGVGPLLHAELLASQRQLIEGFGRSIPDMFAKANRWVAEMQEIAAFLGDGRAEKDTYASIAAFYERIGADFDCNREEIGVLDTFIHLPDKA
jgi:3-hydroxyisobutyrate dehydrogenase-like beta-hydroxyacid dehydrogenase